MKPDQHIDVWIAPDGAVTVSVSGFTGTSCEEATAFLEGELGTVGRRQRTRDWYRRDHARKQPHRQNLQNRQNPSSS